MADQIVTVLDTTIGDIGAEQRIPFAQLKLLKPIMLHFVLAAGDVIALEGKVNEADPWVEIFEFPNDRPRLFHQTHFWRIVRKTDGGVGDSRVIVENHSGAEISGHSA